MKLILSRKGFDSQSGGCPSPIFPNGTLYSLPIPHDHSEDYLWRFMAWRHEYRGDGCGSHL